MHTITRAFALTLGSVIFAAASTSARAQAARTSFALEADAISFFIGGHSAIGSATLANHWLVAVGTGKYDLPSFLLEGDANYDAAQWKATATSVQLVRVGYRVRGAGKNGPVLGVVALGQRMRLSSVPLGGATRFRTRSVGATAGYYQHIGGHFYLYPTFAFTRNKVVSGSTTVGSTAYTVEKWGPNASLHAGWEWTR